MKLKDLERVINPVYVRLDQKGVAWYDSKMFEGDNNDYYRYTRIDNPDVRERKVYSVRVRRSWNRRLRCMCIRQRKRAVQR